MGDDHASLGSDWDGAIIPPRDMPTPLELPRLVDGMLRRSWSPERIGKILGGNFLRTVAALARLTGVYSPVQPKTRQAEARDTAPAEVQP